MSGIKFDQGKPDLSLIPYSAAREEARGFMLGAEKYGRYNFTKGMEASRIVAAALRHINTWFHDLEEKDPESGAHHLGHARCCLAMLIETQRLGTLIDNRNKPTATTSSTEEVIGRLADGSEVKWLGGSRIKELK